MNFEIISTLPISCFHKTVSEQYNTVCNSVILLEVAGMAVLQNNLACSVTEVVVVLIIIVQQRRVATVSPAVKSK